MSVSPVLGQLLLLRLGDERWSSALERFLRAGGPGGIVISGRQLSKPERTAELLRKISRTLAAPPFLAIEEEGGEVDPLRSMFPPLPSPRAAAATGPTAVAQLGELVGAAMRLLGLNTNLAPRLDLGPPSTPADSSSRTFSADSHEVAHAGDVFLQGLARHKILGCAKYFPGAGYAEGTTPSAALPIGKTMAELWREDLVPYRALLPRLPFVLIGNRPYKAFDGDFPRPASCSENVVVALLRVKLGYRGVAVADDLTKQGTRGTSRPGEAAAQAIKAGCDLLLLGGGEESTTAALAGLRQALERGTIAAERVEKALARLRAARQGLARPTGKVSHRAILGLARKFEEFSKAFSPQEKKIA